MVEPISRESFEKSFSPGEKLYFEMSFEKSEPLNTSDIPHIEQISDEMCGKKLLPLSTIHQLSKD